MDKDEQNVVSDSFPIHKGRFAARVFERGSWISGEFPIHKGRFAAMLKFGKKCGLALFPIHKGRFAASRRRKPWRRSPRSQSIKVGSRPVAMQ